MAISYLSSAQKTSISDVINNIHETFAREVVAYKDGEMVSISTDSGYNSFYGQTNLEYTPVSLTFKARIRYLKGDEELFSFSDGSSSTGGQNKVALPAGSVKIKVDSAANEFLKDARRIELDGKRFAIVSNARQIAMFGPEYSPYYEYLLTPTDE